MMNGAEDLRRLTAGEAPRAFDAFLAGLQSGMMGALWMLAWMGFSAVWQRRGFWTAENLMANALHPRQGIASGFEWSSVSGLALYLLVYSLLGGLFAALSARHYAHRVRVTLTALLFAIAWYYFSFHLLWRTVSPAIALLHPEQSTIVGHFIYGLTIGRFSTRLPLAESPAPVPVAQTEPAPDSFAPGA
jgi:hypothetical protein